LIEAQGFDSPDSSLFKKPDSDWKKDSDIFRAETMAKIDPTSQTKIYNEFGKTVFANWSQVDPGEKIEIYLKYKLPFNLLKQNETHPAPWAPLSRGEDLWEKILSAINPNEKKLSPYSILIQKQPGAQNTVVNSSLNLPENSKVIWKYPDNLTTIDDGWQVIEDLDADKNWGIIYSF